MTTDTDFAALLEHAYRKPAAELDDLRLERAVRAALGAEDRRRRLVLAGAAVIGSGIAAAGLLALGLAYPLDSVADGLGVMLTGVKDALDSSSGWTFALIGLALAASAAARARQDL
jgi:hypothetical protein